MNCGMPMGAGASILSPVATTGKSYRSPFTA